MLRKNTSDNLDIAGTCSECGGPLYRYPCNDICDAMSCDNYKCEKFRQPIATPRKGETSILERKVRRKGKLEEEPESFFSKLRSQLK